jgi:hypothetical protein
MIGTLLEICPLLNISGLETELLGLIIKSEIQNWKWSKCCTEWEDLRKTFRGELQFLFPELEQSLLGRNLKNRCLAVKNILILLTPLSLVLIEIVYEYLYFLIPPWSDLLSGKS